MALAFMETLPEELLFYIFNLLNSTPPSELNSRREPSLDLIASPHQSLKHVSLVCQRWRRIVSPLLFRNACFRLDSQVRLEWLTCSACGKRPRRSGGAVVSADDLDSTHHLDMMNAIRERLAMSDDQSILDAPISDSHKEHCRFPAEEAATAAWAAHFHHAADDFIRFLQQRHLQSSIRSCVVYSKQTLFGKIAKFPHQDGPREWRYPAAAAMFRRLLSVINPSRLLLLAPPVDLACLTNATIDTGGDWAFSDMDFHLLELDQDPASPMPQSLIANTTSLQPFPPANSTVFAPSSLLHLRNWNHISLNEGSFLKAYGTYEYFERGPPSIITSIKSCLLPSSPPTALKKLTYTAIFPFAHHASFAPLLPYLEELDLQLAPDPTSHILDDPSRRGRAQMMDCWYEMLHVYENVAEALDSAKLLRAPGSEWRFRKFVCADMWMSGMSDDLDFYLMPLRLPVWVEWTPGVFERQQAVGEGEGLLEGPGGGSETDLAGDGVVAE